MYHFSTSCLIYPPSREIIHFWLLHSSSTTPTMYKVNRSFSRANAPVLVEVPKGEEEESQDGFRNGDEKGARWIPVAPFERPSTANFTARRASRAKNAYNLPRLRLTLSSWPIMFSSFMDGRRQASGVPRY